jgi:molybdopterin-containing oxidoreductase family iron-sulfur binding subunit
MVIDLKRCVGCHACSTTCKAENGTPPGNTRAKVMKKEIGKYPDVRRVSIPMLCMHCEDAACVTVCPTGATERREDGIVSLDKEKCIGCRACITACPYGARYFRNSELGYFGKELTPYEEVKYQNKPKGVVDKCDFCLESRLTQGLEPACVQSCITKARIFGKKEEVQELILQRKGYQLRPDLGTNPSVYYLP